MALSRWRQGRQQRPKGERPAARDSADGAGQPLDSGDLLSQILGRLKILQISVDSLGSSIRATQADCQWQAQLGGTLRTDHDELMEAESDFFDGAEAEDQAGAEAGPGQESLELPGWLEDVPACLESLREEQEAELPCLENLHESCSEMSEDVLNPMPLSYLAPYPSQSESISGTPFPRGAAEEQLLSHLLPELEALQASADDAAGALPDELPAPTAQLLATAQLPTPPGAARRRRAQQPAAERAEELARRAACASASRARTASLLLSAVWELLESPREHAAAWPKQLLPTLASSSRAWAVAAACERLEHCSESVRRRAPLAVTRLTGDSGQRARGHALARLGHSDPGVRLVALEAYARLVALSESGFKSFSAVKQICMMLGDGDEAVRSQAVASLSRMVDRGDENAIEEVLDYVDSEDAGVRCTALQALSEIAERGDRALIGKLVPLACKDPSPSVKKLTQLVLSKLVEVGDLDAAEEARYFITGDEEPEVVCEALRQIGLWAGKSGDFICNDPHSRVVQDVARCLKDGDHRVKQVAAQVLREICDRGHEYAVTVLIDYLRDKTVDAHTKLAILDALADLGKGDEYCIEEVKKLADDPDPQLRGRVTGVLCLLR